MTRSDRAASAIENIYDVTPRIEVEVLRAADIAVKAGAEPPLTFMGMGMTGVVFCDAHFAYKVARSRGGRALTDEADWLKTAHGIAAVRPFVAKLEHWDSRNAVIVRECVRGRPGAWGASGKVRDLWDKIAPYMLAEGWLMPELKEDSVVFEERSGQPKIVDAGFAHRVSNRLLDYIEALLDGKISDDDDDYSSLAFYIRSELGVRNIDEKRAKRVLDRLYKLGATD